MLRNWNWTLIKVQSEHSTTGCDANFDEKTQILERYFNCSAPVYSGPGRNIDLELNSITKENVYYRLQLLV